jgi:large subunit ribosomal protein L19
MKALSNVEQGTLRRDLPPFRPGDTVRVHVNIREGEKERIQVFEGVVIRRRRGGASASFTVRKISYGVGVERIFPVESPAVKKLEIKSRGHVRRSRLYYLRELKGKKARLRSKVRDLSARLRPRAHRPRRRSEPSGSAGAGRAARPGHPAPGAPACGHPRPSRPGRGSSRVAS